MGFDIAQIILAVLSLLATIAVSFFIYWLQRRHEIEMQKIENKHRQELLEEKANNFLIDNEVERDYLPWCIISANINKHRNHVRKIYTNFNRCSVELQNEILKIAGFNLSVIEEENWVDSCFDKLEKDIEKYKLGKQPFLYDGAKYFHRGFERYNDESTQLENDRLFQRIYRAAFNFYPDDLESLSSYVEEYFDYVLGTNREIIDPEKMPIPPVDYVWCSQNLGNASENMVCYWVMDLVENFIINIHNRFYFNYFDSLICENSTDAQIETFEDKYYHALYWLYFTYKQKGNKKS